MHRGVLAVTLILLAVIVAGFVAVWMTLPSGPVRVETSSVSYPARLFRFGMETTTTRTTKREIRECVDQRQRSYNDPSAPDQDASRFTNLRPGNHCVRSVIASPAVLTTYHWVSPHTMRSHARVFFGGLAAVVLLVGLAVAVLLRPRRQPPPAAAEPTTR